MKRWAIRSILAALFALAIVAFPGCHLLLKLGEDPAASADEDSEEDENSEENGDEADLSSAGPAHEMARLASRVQRVPPLRDPRSFSGEIGSPVNKFGSKSSNRIFGSPPSAFQPWAPSRRVP